MTKQKRNQLDIEYDEFGTDDVVDNVEEDETYDLNAYQTNAYELREEDNASEQFNEAYPLVPGAKITVDVDLDGIVHSNPQDGIEIDQLDLHLLNIDDDDDIIHSLEPLSVAFDTSTAMNNNEYASNTKPNKNLNEIKTDREDSQITQCDITSDRTEDESVPSLFDAEIVLESKYDPNTNHDATRVLTLQSELNLSQEDEYQNEDNALSQSHELSPLVFGTKVDQEDQQFVQEPLSQNVNITFEMSKDESISLLFYNKEKVVTNIYDADTKNDEAPDLHSQENDCQHEENGIKESNEISNRQLSDKDIAISVVDNDASLHSNTQDHIETDQLHLYLLNTEDDSRFDEIKSDREDSQITQEAPSQNGDITSERTEDESIPSTTLLTSTYVGEIVLKSKYETVTNHDASRVTTFQSELNFSSEEEYQNEDNAIEHLDENLLQGFEKDPVQNGSQAVDLKVKGKNNSIVGMHGFQQEEHNGEDDLLAGKYLDVPSQIVHNEKTIVNEEELLNVYMNIESKHENMQDLLDQDLQDIFDTSGLPTDSSSIVLAKEIAKMDEFATDEANQANPQESRKEESQKDKRGSQQAINPPHLALGEDMNVRVKGEQDGDHHDKEKGETQSNARSSEVEPFQEEDGPSGITNKSSSPLEDVKGTVVDDELEVLQTEEELRKLLLRGDSDRVLGALDGEEDEKAKVTLESGFRTAAIWANTQLDEESNAQTERDEMTLKKMYLATRLSEEQIGYSVSNRD